MLLSITLMSSALVLAGVNTPADRLDVRFEPGRPGAKTEPRFSPYGQPIHLTPAAGASALGIDPLEGRLALGPEREKSPGLRLVLVRSAAGKPYDRLFIDDDGDGALSDKPLTTEPKEQRGNMWSSFAASVKVAHADGGQKVFEDYPLNFWVVVEKADAKPDVIRFSRKGYKVGSAMLGGVAMDVIVSDANNDGVFGAEDWWTVRPSSSTSSYSSEENRKVGDFAWAGSKAWKLKLEGTAGRSGRLEPFDPGITEIQDEEARDLYRADRLAPRAKTPVAFSKEIEKALAEAKARKAPYFLDFETVWCGPCALMDKYVYTSEVVARAAHEIVCIKVDGDDHKDLKEKYQVESFPTGILFGPDGREIARFNGYGSVREMEAFFRKAAP